MLYLFKKIILNRGVRSKSEKTGLLPLSEMKTAVFCIMANDDCFEDCKESVHDFLKKNNLNGKIICFDFNNDNRTPDRDGIMICKKDLSFFGIPKFKLPEDYEPDLLVSLYDRNYFPADYVSVSIKAKCKIGRVDSPVYDIVVSDINKIATQKEILNRIITILESVK